NGDKHLIGGNQNDIFFLQGDLTSGYVDGEGGINILDLGDFASNRGSLQINLNEREPYLVHDGYDYNSFRIVNFQHLLTRKEKPDYIHLGCRTSYVDSRGGHSNSYGQDIIVIGNNQECHYQMQIKMSPYTVIKNQANQGNFSYLLTRGSGDAEIHFETRGKDTAQHQISFNYTLAEIKQLRLLPDNKVIFNLMSEAENGFNVTLSRSNSTKISCIFTDAEMKLGNVRTYTLQQTKKNLGEIVKHYPALAERLQGSIVAHTQNQTVVIGYSLHHDVLENDLLHRSHLVGNGEENIYKITPRKDEKQTPSIILYPPQSHSKKIETLDLRAVIQKVEAHKQCVSTLIVRKKGKNLDLLIKAKVNKQCQLGKKLIVKIILKDAAKIPWTSQLNILAHQSPLEINQVVKNKGGNSRNIWVLSPKPLTFNKTKKIIVLSAQDVEPYTRIMLPKIPHGVNFARTGEYLNDLIIISKRIYQPRTVVIKDFYSAKGHDAHKLLSLSLHFGNVTVNLKDIPSLSLPSLVALQDKKKAKVYNSIFGSNTTNQRIMKAGSSWMTLVGFGSVVAISIAYSCVKHLRRQPRFTVENIAAVALLPPVILPQSHATPILPTTEMVACYNQFLNDDQCAKSQILIGTLIFCANNEIRLAWFKGEKGYDSVYAVSNSTRLDTFELRASGDKILIRREDQCQQAINLKEMKEVSKDMMVAAPIFQEMLRKPLEHYRWTIIWEPFKQQIKQIGLHYLGEQYLIHTNLGDYFRVMGLTPNWQQRDAVHWSKRILSSWLNHNLLSSWSITGVFLETALLHPHIQSRLPGDTYRSKSIIRFIADLLQFGPSVSTFIPSLVDFLCYQHPWSYEIAMGLRGSLALLEVINDRSTWYLTVGLFILPQIPYWLENIGIPVTRYISHTLELLERLLISYSLILSVQEDSQRLAAKKMTLQQADRRVEQGKKQIAWLYNSGVSFFSKLKTSKTEINDTELPNSQSAQTSKS
ncbi:hypothetical protein, partial [Legionella sp.]|uniref:hypothetical protein n=1 Tax=Legionella sp. TaxID=459 RepID=UPI003C93F42D